MTPIEAIQAATINAAQALGMEATLGSIEAGYEADLVAVAGDPTQDVRLLEAVPVVIQAGQLVKDAR